MTTLDRILKMQFYRKKSSWRFSREHEEMAHEDGARNEQEEDENNNVSARVNLMNEEAQSNEAFFNSVLHEKSLTNLSDISEETTYSLSSDSDLPEDIAIFCGAEEALNESTALLKIHESHSLTSSDESWSFMLEAADVAHSSPIPDVCEGRDLRRKIFNKTKELKHLVDLALAEEKIKWVSPTAPDIQLSRYPERQVAIELTNHPESNLQRPPVWCSRGRPPMFSRATCRGRGRGRTAGPILEEFI